MRRPQLISVVKRGAVACVLLVGAVALGGMLGASGAKREPTVLISGSYAVGYGSLAQLRHDASSVAVLESTGDASTPADSSGVPTTVTAMRVVRLLSGSSLPSTVDLRQLGVPGDSGAPVVTTGSLYVAYLTPFQLEPGVDTGEYTLVGGLQGLFEQSSGTSVPSDSSSSFTQAAPATAPDEPTMPTAISIAQAAGS